MSLSDTQILANLNKDIIISPFNPDQLGPNSYDVTLGEWYYSVNEEKMPCYLPNTSIDISKNSLKYLSSENGKQISEYWGVTNLAPNFGAKKAFKITTEYEAELYGVSKGDQIIIVEPGELILAHTNEIVGTLNNFNMMIQNKSTIMRIGVTICRDANFANVGFIGRFCLEISNESKVCSVLRVGQRIAQILFNSTGPVSKPYNGQYNLGKTASEILKNWTPLNMIPKIAVDSVLKANLPTIKLSEVITRKLKRTEGKETFSPKRYKTS